MKKVGDFNKIFIYLLALIKLSYGYKPDILPTHTKCSLQDSICLTREAQKTVQAFVEGIPSLGINTVDSLAVDPIISHADNFTYAWTEIKVGGLRNAVIDNLGVNMDLKIIKLSLHTTLVLDLNFVAEGTFYSTFPVSGTGKGEVTLKNAQLDMIFVYEIIKDKNEKDVMNLKSYYYGLDPIDGVNFNFENVYRGDKEKDKRFNNMLNGSWRIVMNKFGDSFNRKITDKIFESVKTYLSARPLEELALYP